MSKEKVLADVTARIIKYLAAKDTWVDKWTILEAAGRSGIHRNDIELALKELRNTANIGYVKGSYRYYEPREGDDLMQKALDEFDT